MIQSSIGIGEAFLEMFRKLCGILIKEDKFECDLVEFLKYFSEVHFDINSIDNRQRTLLHNAASNGDLGVIRALIRCNANLNIMDKDECTPLCVAIREC